MKKKPQKGTYGYLDIQKKRVLIRTIIYFAISLAVYLIGYITTGNNQNYLTIVAVLGCLPASKSAVNTVMFYRYHGCSADDKEKIESHEQGLDTLYDMVFTSYEKNFEIHHMSLCGNNLIGYSANDKCDAAACEKHLRSLLAQNGLKANAKIFKDLSKYINRMDQIALDDPDNDAQESVIVTDSERSERILSLLRAISI